MTTRVKYQTAYRFLIVKLILELMAITFHLANIHMGRNQFVQEQPPIEGMLYTFSVITTPWPIILLGYYFPLEQFFRQWKEMYHASFNQLEGIRARIRYLLNEGRLPSICLLYIGHFTLASVSISSLCSPRVHAWDYYVSRHFLLRDITNPLASVCMLLAVIILARRFKTIGLTGEAPAYRFDEPLQLSWANRFYYWLSGVILDYLSKVGIKRNKPNRFERFLFRLNDVLINRLDPRRKKGNKNS